MIEVKNLECRIRDRKLFTIDSFAFEDGKSYLLKGENGVGKTSLLKALIGYKDLIRGQIKTSDQTIYQAQQIYLYKKTGLDNFRLVKGDEKKAYDLAKALAIENLLGKAVDVLSGGERQKVAFIRSILAADKNLILDEPFSQMDDKSKTIGLGIALKWQRMKDDRILILVSHDKIDEDLFDKIIAIEDKKLLEKNIK
ncbi:MAG: ABC transporter ATP-binding protein [Tissierellia bacterium]|nr:ABC transporter ATP-binding protein [Tissierellia bacterium]